MRKTRSVRAALVVSVVAATAHAAAPGAQAQAPITECGAWRAAFAVNITTRIVSCSGARKVIRSWNNRAARRGGNGMARRMRCTYTDIGYEAGDVRCVRGNRVVHWQTVS